MRSNSLRDAKVSQEACRCHAPGGQQPADSAAAAAAPGTSNGTCPASLRPIRQPKMMQRAHAGMFGMCCKQLHTPPHVLCTPMPASASAPRLLLLAFRSAHWLS